MSSRYRPHVLPALPPVLALLLVLALPATAFAAKRKCRDIDLVSAENCPDLANDARLVGVAGDDHRSLEWRLNGHAINEYQSRHTSLEQRAFDAPLTTRGVQLD